MILCQAGTIPFLARMMSTQYAVLQIPALKCLASMCFTNRSVSDIVCVTKFDSNYFISLSLVIKELIVFRLTFI